MKYEVSEVPGKNKFDQGDYGAHGRIPAVLPPLFASLDTVFWRPAEIRSAIEHCFQNGSRIVDRQANSERQHKWEKPNLALPILGIEFPLRAEIKHCRRHRRRHEDREINQKHTGYPACSRRTPTAGRWVEQYAEECQQKVGKICSQVRRCFDLYE